MSNHYRNATTVLVLVFAASAAAHAAAAGDAPAVARRPDFRERYGVLAQRNIFVRNRPRSSTVRATGPTTAETRPSGPRRLVDSFVLTGIALQEGRHVAFIENVDTGATERLSPGDAVAGGWVAEVEINALEFEGEDGEVTRVGIGRNLAGGVTAIPIRSALPTVAATPTAPTTGPAGTTQPAGGAPATAPTAGADGGGGDPALSAIEQAMRARRQQQTGGR